jgi:choline dehydrogenase-like flavoprotein
MRSVFEASPLAERISHETYPGPDVRSDDELVEGALDGGYCGYHAAGSCAMGPDDDDVVDSQLGSEEWTACASWTVRSCPPWWRVT